nr:collagen alpha-1(I) chain-like isoform X2 [Anser cygnoides]
MGAGWWHGTAGGDRRKAPPCPSRAPGAGQPVWLGSTLLFIYLPSKFLGQGLGMRRPALVGQKYSRNAPDRSSASARPQASGGRAGAPRVPWLPAPAFARPPAPGAHGRRAAARLAASSLLRPASRRGAGTWVRVVVGHAWSPNRGVGEALGAVGWGLWDLQCPRCASSFFTCVLCGKLSICPFFRRGDSAGRVAPAQGAPRVAVPSGLGHGAGASSPYTRAARPCGGSPWAPGPSQLCGRDARDPSGLITGLRVRWARRGGVRAPWSPRAPTSKRSHVPPVGAIPAVAVTPLRLTPWLPPALPGDTGVTAGTLRHVTAALPRAFLSPGPGALGEASGEGLGLPCGARRDVASGRDMCVCVCPQGEQGPAQTPPGIPAVPMPRARCPRRASPRGLGQFLWCHRCASLPAAGPFPARTAWGGPGLTRPRCRSRASGETSVLGGSFAGDAAVPGAVLGAAGLAWCNCGADPHPCPISTGTAPLCHPPRGIGLSTPGSISGGCHTLGKAKRHPAPLQQVAAGPRGGAGAPGPAPRHMAPSPAPAPQGRAVGQGGAGRFPPAAPACRGPTSLPPAAKRPPLPELPPRAPSACCARRRGPRIPRLFLGWPYQPSCPRAAARLSHHPVPCSSHREPRCRPRGLRLHETSPWPSHPALRSGSKREVLLAFARTPRCPPAPPSLPSTCAASGAALPGPKFPLARRLSKWPSSCPRATLSKQAAAPHPAAARLRPQMHPLTH